MFEVKVSSSWLKAVASVLVILLPLMTIFYEGCQTVQKSANAIERNTEAVSGLTVHVQELSKHMTEELHEHETRITVLESKSERHTLH